MPEEAPTHVVKLVSGPAGDQEFEVRRDLQELRFPVPPSAPAVMLDERAVPAYTRTLVARYTRGLVCRDTFFFDGYTYV